MKPDYDSPVYAAMVREAAQRAAILRAEKDRAERAYYLPLTQDEASSIIRGGYECIA